MEPLRWRYRIQVDVEGSANHARSKGFSVRRLEGQSRRFGEHYPLNQVEIKGGNLGSDVRVVLAPKTTQVYIFTKNAPDINGLESILENLEDVEQTLNHIVVVTPKESMKFGIKKRKLVMSISAMKALMKLYDTFDDALNAISVLVLKEISAAFVHSAKGNMSYAKKRADAILNALNGFQQNLIEWAKKQGIKEAAKWEEELKRSIVASQRMQTELISARSSQEINEILKKYLTSMV